MQNCGERLSCANDYLFLFFLKYIHICCTFITRQMVSCKLQDPTKKPATNNTCIFTIKIIMKSHWSMKVQVTFTQRRLWRISQCYASTCLHICEEKSLFSVSFFIQLQRSWTSCVAIKRGVWLMRLVILIQACVALHFILSSEGKALPDWAVHFEITIHFPIF